MNRSALTELRGRLAGAKGPSNSLDIEIEVALFQPDLRHSSARSNQAGTKIVYTRRDGSGTDTFWAADYTLDADSRKKALALIDALLASGGANGSA